MNYEALIGSRNNRSLVIAGKVDNGQVDSLGRMLQTYHGSEGSARLMTLMGDVTAVTSEGVIHEEPRSIYPDEMPLGEIDSFDMISVMADVEDVDKVFFFVDGAWREGTRIPDSASEFLWKTAA